MAEAEARVLAGQFAEEAAAQAHPQACATPGRDTREPGESPDVRHRQPRPATARLYEAETQVRQPRVPGGKPGPAPGQAGPAGQARPMHPAEEQARPPQYTTDTQVQIPIQVDEYPGQQVLTAPMHPMGRDAGRPARPRVRDAGRAGPVATAAARADRPPGPPRGATSGSSPSPSRRPCRSSRCPRCPPTSWSTPVRARSPTGPPARSSFSRERLSRARNSRFRLVSTPIVENAGPPAGPPPMAQGAPAEVPQPLPNAAPAPAQVEQMPEPLSRSVVESAAAPQLPPGQPLPPGMVEGGLRRSC